MLCDLKELMMIKGSTDLNLVQPYACNVHARPACTEESSDPLCNLLNVYLHRAPADMMLCCSMHQLTMHHSECTIQMKHCHAAQKHDT